jgi:hypothetical protein
MAPHLPGFGRHNPTRVGPDIPFLDRRLSHEFRHGGEYAEVLAGLEAPTTEFLAGTPFEDWHQRSARPRRTSPCWSRRSRRHGQGVRLVGSGHAIDRG